eukprot:7522584-Karenia_brevis.AAC.1
MQRPRSSTTSPAKLGKIGGLALAYATLAQRRSILKVSPPGQQNFAPVQTCVYPHNLYGISLVSTKYARQFTGYQAHL